MQTEPNQLNDVLTLLTASFIQTAPLEVTDPRWTSFLDSYSIFQQIELNKLLKQKIAEDPSDKAAAALLRAHALFERTRSRMVRVEELANPCGRATPDRDNAIAFLLAELADGERPASDLFATAQSLGISSRTLNRAKAELPISCRLDRSASKRAWMWSLTPGSPGVEAPQPASPSIPA